MSFCDDKKLAAKLSKEARSELEVNLESGISRIIEYPFDNRPNLKKELKKAVKKSDKKFIQQQIINEGKRFLEHKKLFSHFFNKSIEHLNNSSVFIVPNDFVSNRLDFIQGLFQEAYGQSTFSRKGALQLSGLNNSEKWDAGKIRYILNKVQSWEKRAEKDPYLSDYENTIKKPLLVGASLDPTGQALKLVKMTTSALDNYLQKGYSWKISIVDPITQKKNPLSLENINIEIIKASTSADVAGFDSRQNKQLAEQFSEELLHDEVRNIISRDIPTDPKQFIKWRNSWEGKQFFGYIKSESERHEIGESDSKYVMIPLHKESNGQKILRNYRKSQLSEGSISVDPSELENAFLVYRIPDNMNNFLKNIKNNKSITKELLEKDLLKNEIEEGFYTAQEHRVYKYETIANTDMPKRKYANWSKGVDYNGKIYDPPDAWMPGMWKAIDMQREWNELFYEKVLNVETQKINEELNTFLKGINKKLINSGWNKKDIENLIDTINLMGGMQFNLIKDSQGNFATSNSFVRKASRWSYGHVKFDNPIYQSMMEEALNSINKSYLPEIEAQLATDNFIIKSNESSLAEKAEALDSITILESKKKYYESIVENMENLLYGENSTDQDRKQMFLSSKILATKSRTLFTDNKLRRKDRSVHSEYVDQAFRANELTKLKLELFKTVLSLQHNQPLVNYLVDQVKVASGGADIEAGFMNLNYSDQRISDILSKYISDITPEKVKQIGLIIRGYLSAANLGVWTAVTNNTQRLNKIINYGWKKTWEAMDAVKNGIDGFTASEIREQVEETGVLHPGNAFIDMLSMNINMQVGTEWKEALAPIRDVASLWKATTLDSWLNRSNSLDNLIKRASSQVSGEKVQLEEIKRIKTELYNIVNDPTKNTLKDKKRLEKRLKDLRLGLTQSGINRLINWKLQWFPLGLKNKMFTMAGTEEQMRLEVAFQGLKEAKEMGLINTEKKNWKYTDSPEAVEMARLYVYTNLFGFTQVMNPKMFRGAVGGKAFLWRQYDYNQVILEYEMFRSAAMSPEWAAKYGEGASMGALIAARLPFQIGKNIIRAGTQTMRAMGMSKEQVSQLQKTMKLNPELDDKNLQRATLLMMTRGMASIASFILYTQWAPYTILREGQLLIGSMVGKNKINQRALMGFGSPLVTKTLMIATLISAIIKAIDGDDTDDFIEDVLRELPFSVELTSLFLWLYDFSGNAIKGVRPYLPSPIKEVAQSIDNYID